MKIIKQVAIFFGICLVAEAVSKALPFPFPGSLLGLLLLTALLTVKLVKLEQIKETADFMLGIMGMFFVPAVTGIFEEIAAIQGILFKIIVIVAISMTLSFCFTYGVVSGIRKIMRVPAQEGQELK